MLRRSDRLAGLAALVACSVLAPLPASAQSAAPPTEYELWNRALRSAVPDPARGADVSGLVLQRDEAEITLEAGRLHFLAPIEGRVVGAVFTGQGRFRMGAPIPVEEAQLVRVFEQDTVSQTFTSAVLLFTDDTDAELTEVASFVAAAPPAGARAAIETAIEVVQNGEEAIDRDLMIPLVNGGGGLFYAHFRGGEENIVFQTTPYSAEEVTLSRERSFRGERYREVVASFHKRSDYETGRSLPPEALDLVRVLGYEIESTIDEDLEFSAVATARLTIPSALHEWVPFHLFSELEVDSILWAPGQPARFFRPAESSDLWIDLMSAPGQPTALTFHYHGELLTRPQPDLWITVKSHGNWFPFHEYGRPATYRLTFHTPAELTVASVGRLVSREVADEVVTTVWETPEVRQVTFNVGEFAESAITDPEAPPIKVQVSERAHRALRGMAARARAYIPQQEDMDRAVSTDLVNSFAMYNEVYGPSVVPEFLATETAFLHGEAFPGLVLLSWATFQMTNDKGYDEMFRAHEVAHQYWGIGVRPATYRDQWLAEGFSEFSGLWYMARSRGSIDLFRRRLEETRDAILERRDRSAPIALGTRVFDRDFPTDHQTIVYAKGAWVLHMLRTILTDQETGSDEHFTALMHEFYSRYRGRTATTEQFQALVEERLGGADMSWFFDQWVRGSAIPTYTFSHRFEDQPDGTVKGTVRVRQDRVPEDFRMLVPLLLEFEGDQFATLLLDVKGPVTEIELPIMPSRPATVTFNPNESVLAETKTEGWR